MQPTRHRLSGLRALGRQQWWPRWKRWTMTTTRWLAARATLVKTHTPCRLARAAPPPPPPSSEPLSLDKVLQAPYSPPPSTTRRCQPTEGEQARAGRGLGLRERRGHTGGGGGGGATGGMRNVTFPKPWAPRLRRRSPGSSPGRVLAGLHASLPRRMRAGATATSTRPLFPSRLYSSDLSVPS